MAFLGGALPGAVVAASLLGCAALVLVVVERGGTLCLPPLALVPLAAAGVCLLQLLPLPAGLLAHLGPASADIRDFALLPLGLVRARPVTLDAPATWVEVARALGLAATLTAAAELARSRRSRRRLAAGIGLLGVAVALVGYGHALANAHSLFGLHTFENAQLAFLTPFGNPNHLAGFLTLSTVLLLGLAAEAPERPRAALWLAFAVCSGAAAFLSLSRGGIFFFVAGQLAFVLTLVLGRVPLGSRESYRPGAAPGNGRERLFLVTAGVAGVLALAGFLAMDRISARLSTLDSLEKLRQSKVELWPMFARAALHVWPLGPRPWRLFLGLPALADGRRVLHLHAYGKLAAAVGGGLRPARHRRASGPCRLGDGADAAPGCLGAGARRGLRGGCPGAARRLRLRAGAPGVCHGGRRGRRHPVQPGAVPGAGPSP